MTSISFRIASIAALAAVMASCHTPSIGEPITLDADEVATLAERDGVTIPDGFEFVEGRTHSEFSGQPAWSARYSGAPDAFDGEAVAEANPSFPPMRTAACDPTPTTSAGNSTWCKPSLITELPPGGVTDTMTIELTHEGDGTKLVVSSQGH
ncbi:hypothetical protein HQ325_16760 [Rhodococcus sp. BP-349]|uniref:hypothetical protein n=1 Tax=unclassified Rhodococcus (in: high G+C Gram-positive bacteria) TaxID=192944 RepID=UPI001C9A6E7A|nr:MULTISPECIES: hypothetical protein [unclassified Rhodococcus (in: high G+C Gram-positive bacteria)]MBY6540327.1 hypothetical protein [Rhodococcus sp. BP-363]MBY6545648.1 hypothetical protein [Rhodococcus sp. BP-369]MBY6564878.1 hypothetical protein [Rhodococcus sp. BP-370]MBY6578186.1 hypothetical protein [Rhodococcus sp. BP-364]MBY6587487.1 hypothetical protein [Rhodococcus sp. BP-358]